MISKISGYKEIADLADRALGYFGIAREFTWDTAENYAGYNAAVSRCSGGNWGRCDGAQVDCGLFDRIKRRESNEPISGKRTANSE